MIALTDIDIDIYIWISNPEPIWQKCVWNKIWAIKPNIFWVYMFLKHPTCNFLWRSFRLMPLKSCIPPMRAQASAPATRELQEWARLSRVCCDIPPKISWITKWQHCIPTNHHKSMFFDSSIDATFFKLKVAFWDDSWPKMILQTTKSTVGVI